MPELKIDERLLARSRIHQARFTARIIASRNPMALTCYACLANRTLPTAGFLFALALGYVPSAYSQEKPDVAKIIERSVDAANRDWAAAPEFDCFERDKNRNGDKTYEDIMIDGSVYQRLVAINGKPLPPQQQTEQAQKMEKEKAKRRRESPEQRASRIAKYQTERNRDHALLAELTKAFDFTLSDQKTMANGSAYLLKATPRPGYRPPTKETQVLTGMEGQLWIDAESFQWIKVEAHVIRPVSIEGFLARVEPGTCFELEKMPVAPGLWFAKHFAMRSRARILYAFRHRSQDDETYFNYHRAEPDAANAQAIHH